MSAAQTVGHGWSVLGMASDVRDHASRLVNLGLHPIEVYGLNAKGECLCGKCGADENKRGKHPMWVNWQTEKLDTKKLDRHLKDGKRNIGLRMGRQPDGSSLVAIDVDGDAALLDPLVKKWGELPPTLTQRTGSGGTHFVFRWPAGREMPGNSAGKHAPKVDVRSEGGQIVVAPSQHHSGKQYAWTRAVEPAELPAAWVEGLTERPKALPLAPATSAAGSDPTSREARARAYIATMPEAISGANGHGALWAVARKLVADFKLDEQTAMVLVREYNNRCVPPWSEPELLHKIRDASKADVSNPIADRPLAERESAPVVYALPDEAPQTAITPVHQEAHDGVVVDKWEKFLHYNLRQELTKDVGNALLIVKNAEGFKDCLRYNKMAGDIFWFSKPGYKVGIDPPEVGSVLADQHIPYVQHVLLQLFNLSVGKDIAWSAMVSVAHANAYHPVQDYLNSLTWDGKPRVEKWLSTYMGAEPNIYNHGVGKWWLISAVARAMRPGCQADHVLILEGKQGKGKSQAIKALGGTPWVLESLPNLQNGDKAIEAIGGKWLVEIAELDALKGASMTRIKDFVTQQVDKYRPPYARATTERPRSCVFVGTTNDKQYLRDPTGARRFWGVDLQGKINRKRLSDDRDQIWAEAKAMLEAGEQWHPPEEMVDLIADEQEDRRVQHPWEEKILAYVNEHGIENITVDDVLANCLHKFVGTWSQTDKEDVQDCLEANGYEKYRPSVKDKKTGKVTKLPARWRVAPK